MGKPNKLVVDASTLGNSRKLHSNWITILKISESVEENYVTFKHFLGQFGDIFQR